MIQGVNPLKTQKQETGKGLIAMDGVQKFSLLEFSPAGMLNALFKRLYSGRTSTASFLFSGEQNAYRG